jgi:hypothetical protein
MSVCAALVGADNKSVGPVLTTDLKIAPALIQQDVQKLVTAVRATPNGTGPLKLRVFVGRNMRPVSKQWCFSTTSTFGSKARMQEMRRVDNDPQLIQQVQQFFDACAQKPSLPAVTSTQKHEIVCLMLRVNDAWQTLTTSLLWFPSAPFPDGSGLMAKCLGLVSWGQPFVKYCKKVKGVSAQALFEMQFAAICNVACLRHKATAVVVEE